VSPEVREVIEAANALSALLEAAAPKGLKHRRHQQHIAPARARLQKLFAGYFKRQGAAVLAVVRPRIQAALTSHPIQESSAGGKRFSDALIPASLHPLRFAVTAAEEDEYASIIKAAIAGAAKTLAAELKSGATISDDVAGDWLRENSLTKLTGGFSETSIDRLRNAVADAWDKGGSADQIVTAIKDTFADFSDSRAEMIAQTEANDAYMEGRDAMAQELGMEEKIWSADGSDACEECQGQIEAGWVPIDEDFPSGDDPPLHPNCFLGSTSVSAIDISYAIRRWYEGEICILRFAELPELSVTPNHPILARNRWCAAGDLQPGNEIVQCLRPSLAPSAVDPYHNYVETSIQQIFDTLLISGSVLCSSMPVPAEAFHGDGGVNGKVEIVRADRTLDLKVESLQDSLNLLFTFSERRRGSLNAEGAAAQIGEAALAASYSIMGSLNSSSLRVSGHPGIDNSLSSTSTALLEPNQIPVADDGNAGNTDASRHRQNAFSGEMRFVKIIEIERRQFSGHVYNLNTKSGLYLANTIVAHNCDCGVDYRKGHAE
jgi:hypothetical protein